MDVDVVEISSANQVREAWLKPGGGRDEGKCVDSRDVPRHEINRTFELSAYEW